ncbi:MAG TPA: helix-turn-helix domain-containing protein [Thermoanaerobaculia bacterium]|nr:helix-turn-helix domain-containing protein [Thermoanaerobaculia bacterium]
MHHLARCQPCLAAAADYLAHRKEGPPLRAAEPRAALVTFVQEEARSAVEALEARVWWAAIRELSPAEQIRKVRSVAALRSLPVFEVILGEMSTVGRSDPFLGESMAGVALAIIDHLPESQCPKALKNDLRGKVLIEVGNCRRVAADWRGSAEGLAVARRNLSQGTGDAGLEGRLLSIQASLYTDTGNFEKALSCASRAVEIYRELEDWQGVAHNLVLEAGCLIAACRHKEAIRKARSALEHIPPHEIRLQILARLILVEGLVILGRPLEALRYFQQAEPLCKEAELGMQLRLLYQEAILLDGLGQVRESEKLFRVAIKSLFEHEHYRDAFVAMLTLFECFCRRGALTKAAALCEAAIEATSEAGEACNDQIRRAWEELLAAVRVRQLSEEELVHARRFLIRNWSVPVAGALVLPRPETLSTRASVSPPAPPPIPSAEELQSIGYQNALASYDQQLIEAALKVTGGNISEASRMLGLSRNGLKNKIRQYGL